MLVGDMLLGSSDFFRGLNPVVIEAFELTDFKWLFGVL